MGVNEIRDMDSLLTERLANVRRVQRREGEAGGSNKGFQQVFEFAKHGEEEEHKEENAAAHSPEPPPPAPRALSPEDIEKARKRHELDPGQIIDVEA